MTITSKLQSMKKCAQPELLEYYQLTSNGLCSAKVIWSFWEGNIPDVVARCLSTIKAKNPSRMVIVLSTATLPFFLEPDDYPCYHGIRGSPEEFSCVQYLADWVRLTLLEKYGGVWFDASTICTSAVEEWISPEPSDVTMFPMHANPNVHGNWALGTSAPGHPVIRAWRTEFAAVLNECGPGKVPTDYIERAFRQHTALRRLWSFPSAPPLPYLWVYLTLQVALQKQPELHSNILLRSSVSGPMHRRYLFDVVSPKEDTCASQLTANHLAALPLEVKAHDRWFVKLVGSDRKPVEEHLNARSFAAGSALDTLSRQSPASISSMGVLYFPNTGRKKSIRRELLAVSPNHSLCRRRSSVASAA